MFCTFMGLVDINFELCQNPEHVRFSKLSRILHLGFREYYKLGNLDWGWQSPYTVNMLFLPSSLRIIALRLPIAILSQIIPNLLSLLKNVFRSSSYPLPCQVICKLVCTHSIMSTPPPHQQFKFQVCKKKRKKHSCDKQLKSE